MKNKAGNMLKAAVLAFAVILAAVPTFTQTVSANSSLQRNQRTSSVSADQPIYKYPFEVMKAVRIYLGAKPNSTEMDRQINTMSKTEIMDIYLASKHNKAKGKVIRKAVDDIFNISLDTISANGEGNIMASYPADIMEGVRKSLHIDPSSTELDAKIMSMAKVAVMDKFLQSFGKEISGSESRRMINEIFGVNLNGIDSLAKARISLFSKGQWITQTPTDIFVILTGKGDVDINVGVTDYYKQKTGSDQLPVEVQDFLKNLGFTYQIETNFYTYTNPSGESVPDSFKGQLIGKLVSYIHDHYLTL
ncbi:hypothetical protein ACFPES_19675 [Paenibacillus sp. GCM10023248]|uniref:hypothetical protein n=1 Tax=unclassified Paenibacillus TaxID=185978 RepID=UPI0023797142|nr:hypothetical protein [Paenibacillus sp. MAHUQ-63]MDD9269272.1 hypothetical protein [Paenibacillus sp. MAHUQ-63]